MAKESNNLRNLGLALGELTAPPDSVRTSISDRQARTQMAISGAVALAGVAGAGLAIWFVAFPLNLLAGAATIASFAGGIYLAIHRDYRWVELSGTTIRAKHLYTGRIVECQVSEIACLRSSLHPAGGVPGAITARLFGLVKAIEVRFRGGQSPIPIPLFMPAMSNADEFFKALQYRMAELGEIDAELVQAQNKPIVRSFYWKAAPPPKERTTLAVALGITLFFAWSGGMLFTMDHGQQQSRFALRKQPAQVMTLAELIRGGPGANRHLLLTEFAVGGCAYESSYGRWDCVRGVLLDKKEPLNRRPGIDVVFESNSIKSDEALNQVLSAERLEVICSAEPKACGTGLLDRELQNDVRKVLPEFTLSSAWVLEDLSDPPTAKYIANGLMSASASLCLSIVLAGLILWRVR